MKIDQNRIELKVINSIYDEGVFVPADGSSPALLAGTLVALGLPVTKATVDQVTQRMYLRKPDETALVGAILADDVADIYAFEPAIVLENALLGKSINHESDFYTHTDEVVDPITGRITRENPQQMTEHALARRVVNGDVYLIRAVVGDYRMGQAVYAIQKDNGIYVTNVAIEGGMRIGWAQEDYVITEDMVDEIDDSTEERPSTINLNGKLVNLLRVRIGLKSIPRGITASSSGGPSQTGSDGFGTGTYSSTSSVSFPLSNALTDDAASGVGAGDFSVNVLDSEAGADETKTAANVLGVTLSGRLLTLTLDPVVDEAVYGILVCSNEALADLTGEVFPVFPHDFTANANGSFGEPSGEIVFQFDSDSIVLTKANLVYDESLVELGDLVRDERDGSIYRVPVTLKFSDSVKAVSIGVELPGVSKYTKNVYLYNGNSILSSVYSIDEDDPNKVTLVITTSAPVAYNAAIPEITSDDFQFSNDVESIDEFFVDDDAEATKITIKMTMKDGVARETDGSYRDPFTSLNEQLKQLLANSADTPVVSSKLKVGDKFVWYDVTVDPVNEWEKGTTTLKVVFSLNPQTVQWDNRYSLDIGTTDFYILYGKSSSPNTFREPISQPYIWERDHGTISVQRVIPHASGNPNEWTVVLNNNLTKVPSGSLVGIRLICDGGVECLAYSDSCGLSVVSPGNHEEVSYWVIQKLDRAARGEYRNTASNKLYDAFTDRSIKITEKSLVSEKHPVCYSKYEMLLVTDKELSPSTLRGIHIQDITTGAILTAATPINEETGDFDSSLICDEYGNIDVSWGVAATIHINERSNKVTTRPWYELNDKYGVCGFVPIIAISERRGLYGGSAVANQIGNPEHTGVLTGYRYNMEIRIYVANGVGFPTLALGPSTFHCRLIHPSLSFDGGQCGIMNRKFYPRSDSIDSDAVSAWAEDEYGDYGVTKDGVKYLLDQEFYVILGSNRTWWFQAFPLTIAGLDPKN